jgi:hypothetical protein
MIGTKQIVIDAQEFLRGMTSSANVGDGGFSPETDAVNLSKTPGVIYAPAAAVDSDTDTRLTGNIIASCPDMTQTSPVSRLVVADNGTLYRYDGTKINAAAIASDGSTYTKGFTDIITFRGEAYVSSKSVLRRWQNDNTMDAGASWPFSFSNANVPHPGIVFEDNMYWADGNLLLRQSTLGDAVAPTTILTLDTSQIIYALGIDPGSGKMLLSIRNVLDVSCTIPAINKVLWYDGFSNKVSKSSVVEDTVLSFEPVGGIVFVGYGKTLGYLNGSGIQFVRRLDNVTLSNTDLPYKHNMTRIGKTLYVVDGRQILAFGEVLPGQRIAYYCFKNNVNSNNLSSIFDAGSGKIGMGFSSNKFYTTDTTSSATTNTMSFITKRYAFDRPVILNGVYLEYADQVTANDNNRSIAYKTQKQLAYVNLAIQSGTSIRPPANVYEIDQIIGFSNTDNKVRWVQFRYLTDTTNFGLRRIILYYTPAE